MSSLGLRCYSVTREPGKASRTGHGRAAAARREPVKGRPVTELTADGPPSSPVSGVSSTRAAASQGRNPDANLVSASARRASSPATWLRLAGSGSVTAAAAATAWASAEKRLQIRGPQAGCLKCENGRPSRRLTIEATIKI